MDEAPNELERRLERLRLRPVSPGLVRRVAVDLAPAPSPRRGDRLLWSAIGSGAAAACVIVGVFLSDRSGSPARPFAPQPRGVASDGFPRPLEALARADRGWTDEADTLIAH